MVNTCGTSIARYVVSVTAHRGGNNGPTGTQDETANIKLYPNPTTGVVNLELTGSKGDATIMVSDVSGKVIVTKTTSEKSLDIDLSNVPAGIYLVRVNMDGKVFNEKVMVQ